MSECKDQKLFNKILNSVCLYSCLSYDHIFTIFFGFYISFLGPWAILEHIIFRLLLGLGRNNTKNNNINLR